MLTAAGVYNADIGGKAQAQLAQQVLGVLVHGDALSVNGRLGGHVVHAALALLLLQLQGDTAHLVAALDAAHQVGDETGNLVAHALGGDQSDLIGDLQWEKQQANVW